MHSLHSRRPAATVATLLLLALPGCATAARARAAQDRTSAIPGERTPTAAELGLPTQGRVALGVLVRTALRVHPTVVAARRAAEAAFARVRAAEGARLPQVSVNADAAWRDATQTGATPVEHRFQSFGFDVSWVLFDFGELAAFARQAAEQWMAAQQEARSAEVDQAFAVRTAYFELDKNLELLGVARATVAQFQARLDQVTELEKVGKRIPYDVTKAKVDLGNAALAEITTRNAVATSRATLATTVGLAEALEWVPDAPDAAGHESYAPKDFDAAWAATLPSRPSLAAVAARERAACAVVDARIAALYPSLSLGLGYGKAGAQPPLPWSFDLGPSLRWTPFDGFQNLASIEEAVAALREARTAFAREQQLAWLGVRTAWIAIEDATQRLELTALLVASAEENYALAQGRFDAGVGTSIDLSDASQALVSAQADRIRARADRAIAFARLAQAVGLAAKQP